MADTEMSAVTGTEISAETDTETDNFRSLKQITHSPHQPRHPAGIFYWPDTHNKISAIWIRTHNKG
jgi:hypothetical protein